MTHARRQRVTRARVVVFAAVVGLLAGCVNYPKITDIGGTRIRPEHARLVRQADGAALYVDLHSTGKFGDVIVGAGAPVARQARLVDETGAEVKRIEVPGIAVVALQPGSPHVQLSGLTRPLATGETVVVTLTFEKTGHLGVVSVVE